MREIRFGSERCPQGSYRSRAGTAAENDYYAEMSKDFPKPDIARLAEQSRAKWEAKRATGGAAMRHEVVTEPDSATHATSDALRRNEFAAAPEQQATEFETRDVIQQPAQREAVTIDSFLAAAVILAREAARH